MHTIENPIPRLVLLRIVPPFSTADARSVATRVHRIFLDNAPEKTAVFSDVRASHLFEAGVEEAFIELMKADNPLLACSGILYTAGVTTSRQAIHVVRASGSDLRIATADRDELEAWFRERVDDDMAWEIHHFVRRGDELETLLQTQAQLVQTEKMAALGRMVAGIAHEINNPVNFIASGLPLIREDFADMAEKVPASHRDAEFDELRERFAELTLAVEEGAERTVAIIEGLRTFSRVDEAEVKAVDLNESIESTVRLLAHETRHGIVVDKRYGDLPLVECYAGELNQVFMNLLVNAIQALEGEGTVTITTTAGEDAVQVSIRDDGPGMEPAVQQRLFDPFFTTKPVGVGTGLGLAISHGIIERHRGAIRVESEVGQGSDFVITLPLRVPNDESSKLS